MELMERQFPPTGPAPTPQCTDSFCTLSNGPIQTSAATKSGNQDEVAASPQAFPAPSSLTQGEPFVTGAGPEKTQQSSSMLSPTGSNPAAITGAQETAISSNEGSGGLSGGAVAGVAIACLIVGAALAFAAAFIFFKRRNKPRDSHVSFNNYSDSSPELVTVQKSVGRNSPYVQVSQTPLPAPVAVRNSVPASVQQPPDVLASILPLAAHETEVQDRVAALFKQIHCHIDTYYRDVHASITPSIEPELARFGAKGINMAELLQDSSSPTTALKHALMAYILGITGPKKGDDGETLFPDELGYSHPRSVPTNTNLEIASTIHRRLSVLLYTSECNSPTAPRRSWSFQSDIREAAEHFSLTFFPWANPGCDDQEKEDDLTRTISEVLELRVWLFGQPSEYDFRWDGVGSRGVVVSPELVKRDEAGGRDRVVLESCVSGL
ncbi:hypothetical protein FB567DRAFT_590047 [Paraphoma chrysanthemicola]|uniref:Uncharacterized protein n=1 Tax=Paraphoma chrysanthemicola TaxID=798071 RepID=A0A8K0RBI4_9PLEO|nr:hypothetical protein FB567DRAFT_590047 [Paraphoma chrysanthemicola]